ncbi:MAG: hypothetical protein WBV33_00075 [Terracidiphilus sp.]
MQKALSEMNLQLHHVLSEIPGVSGLKILDAILALERDRMKLAGLCNWPVRSPREVVAKSLEAVYREEHLFALRQPMVGYRFYQSLIAKVDVELESKTRELPRAAGGPEEMPPRTKEWTCQWAGNEPTFDHRSEMFRIGTACTRRLSPLVERLLSAAARADRVRSTRGKKFRCWSEPVCPR